MPTADFLDVSKFLSAIGFEEIDANRDEKISVSEFKAKMKQMGFDEGEMGEQWFALIDKSGDGFIRRDEFDDVVKVQFSRISLTYD